jgi:hypothetical protein
MLEPFALSEFNNGTTIAFNMRGVDALFWYEILPLDHLATFGVGAQ